MDNTPCLMGGAPPLPDTLSRIPPSPPCQNDMKRGLNTIGEILEKFFGKLGSPSIRTSKRLGYLSTMGKEHKHVERIDNLQDKKRKLTFRMVNQEKRQEKINMRQNMRTEQIGRLMGTVLVNPLRT